MSDYGSLRKERSLSRLKDEGAQRRHPRMAVDPKCRPHACLADGSLVHRGLPVLVAAAAISPSTQVAGPPLFIGLGHIV